jgi:hypothetical protein
MYVKSFYTFPVLKTSPYNIFHISFVVNDLIKEEEKHVSSDRIVVGRLKKQCCFDVVKQ